MGGFEEDMFGIGGGEWEIDINPTTPILSIAEISVKIGKLKISNSYENYLFWWHTDNNAENILALSISEKIRISIIVCN